MDLSSIRNIKGEFISLAPVIEEDAESIYEWRKGISGQYLNHPENYTLEGQRKWIATRPPSEINYIIRANTGEKARVGMISIVDIDTFHKKAEVGRLLLDEKWLTVSNPFGLEALKISYDIVLNKWGFNKIYGSILSLNSKMIELQKFLGMTEEGILRNHLFVQNDYRDLHLLSIFQKDVNSKFLPRINFLLKSFR